jgi:ABC-type transporter Mla subunit MlaD
MSAAPQLITVPTQPEIDKLAEEYQSLEKEFAKAEGELKAAAAKLDQKADELIRLVTNFGSAMRRNLNSRTAFASRSCLPMGYPRPWMARRSSASGRNW